MLSSSFCLYCVMCGSFCSIVHEKFNRSFHGSVEKTPAMSVSALYIFYIHLMLFYKCLVIPVYKQKILLAASKQEMRAAATLAAAQLILHALCWNARGLASNSHLISPAKLVSQCISTGELKHILQRYCRPVTDNNTVERKTIHYDYIF